ncbi:MAG: FAD-dependent oxidoreductase [Pseudomonadota bacterium]
MNTLHKVLIIGGGIAGMCAAIQLRKLGLHVELVELDKEWRAQGAGITISGPTLRALREIGVVEEVMAAGATWNGLTFNDADGHLLREIAFPKAQGAEDLPGTGALMRPELARILGRATLAAGVQVRLGVTFDSIQACAEHVDLKFSDGSSGRYDLVIGADGLMSKVRTAIFPGMAKPAYTGQGCWRAVLPRPKEIKQATMFLGARTKVGLNPVSANEVYLYFLDHRDSKDFIAPETWRAELGALLSEFGGVVGELRDQIASGAIADPAIMYRPLEAFIAPAPWHNGRVVLIGDAVHATTPHLASGAGIAVEDAVVLAQELAAGGTLDEALHRFTARRYERCRLVIDNSVRLGEIEQTGGSREEHGKLMIDSIVALAAPI